MPRKILPQIGHFENLRQIAVQPAEYRVMLDISPTDRMFVLTGAGVSAESGISGVRGLCSVARPRLYSSLSQKVNVPHI